METAEKYSRTANKQLTEMQAHISRQDAVLLEQWEMLGDLYKVVSRFGPQPGSN